MKRIIIFLFFVLLLSVNVAAQGSDDVYKQQYEISGAQDIQQALPDDVREFLNSNDIDPSDSNWVMKITQKSVFRHITEFLSGGAKTPFKVGAALLGIILITAAVGAISESESADISAVYISVLAIVGVVAMPLWETVSAATSAVKGCGTFMLSFVPVFASIVALSGGGVTSASMGALLLGAAETVVAVASFAVLPMMGGYLGMSLCASVSPLQNTNAFPETVKKISMWVLSLVLTLFTGILGIQTAVNAAADTLTLKTARFIIGSSVPVAGPALSEAASAVTASVTLLRSSVGIYGIFALGAIILPVAIELVLWRIVCAVCLMVSDLLSVQKISGLLKVVDAMTSVLLGVVLFVAAIFIISLTVVIGAVKSG